MKFTAFVVMLLVVGSLAIPSILDANEEGATPEAYQARRVTSSIRSAIQNIINDIANSGLDPLEYNMQASYELPVPILFSASAVIDNFQFTGLSNIVTQDLSYSGFTKRLRFNLVIPRVSVSVDTAGCSLTLFGTEYAGDIKGSVHFNSVRLVVDARVNLGLISGINVRSARFSVGTIESNLKANLFGKDISSRLNDYVETSIQEDLANNAREINDYFASVVLTLIREAVR